MKSKPIILGISLLTVLFIPVFAFAADSVMGGISNSGGFLGVSGSSGFFGVSFGSGVGCMGTICSLGNTVLFIINAVLVPVLFAISFIVFLFGIAKSYIFSVGDSEGIKNGHKFILWGVVGFVVMISLWGLVNMVASTFGLYGYSAPFLPRSY